MRLRAWLHCCGQGVEPDRSFPNPTQGQGQARWGSPWFPLRFNQFVGRPLARPAVGFRAHRRRAPDPLHRVCLRRFWLLSFGLYVPVPAPLAPVVPPGACAPESLLRRSFVAYFLRIFPGSCPAGRRACTCTAPQASPAAKNNGGRGELAGHHWSPHPPTSRQEGATP
jgi:hypothetical protein